MIKIAKRQQASSIEVSRDIILVNILSTLLVATILLFSYSPVRMIFGLPFILFFPGYVLICALFPRKNDLDGVERLVLSFGMSIAVTSLIGLALNFTPFGIRLYPAIISVLSFILLISIVAVYRRRKVSPKDAFAPLTQINISKWLEEIKTEFIKLNEINKMIKIIVIICFILITISVIMAWNPPATGYEPCIFAATPLLLWISLILSIISGITIIIHQIYNKQEEKNNLLKIGFLLIFLSYITIISLHIIRGYYMWCMIGDPATHIGWIKEGIRAGYISHTIFYPILHIYAAHISQLLLIDLISLHKLLPLFFGILFVPFVYLFAKSILPKKGEVILATIASCTLLHGWYLNFTPNHHSVLLFPMLLFILTKAFTTHKIEWKILLIIMVFLYPPFHPVPVLALLVTLITLWLSKRAFNLIGKYREQTVKRGFDIFNSILLWILLVWGIAWISSFGVWGAMIRNIYTVIIEGGPVHLDALVDKAALAERYGISVIENIVRKMWGTFVYIMLALICLPILWKVMHTDKQYNNLFALYGPLAIIALCIAMFFFHNVGGLEPIRILFFVVIICSLFVGFILYRIIKKIRETNKKFIIHKFALALVIILVTGVFINGILITFPSPYIRSTSWHTTQMEVYGMDWTFHHRDIDVPITGISIAPHRFAHLLLTPEEQAEQRIPWDIPENIRVPFRFGYLNHTTLSASFERGVYLIVQERCRSAYRDIFPELAEIRWMPCDFERLKHDTGLDKVYTSGEFDLWRINAKEHDL